MNCDKTSKTLRRSTEEFTRCEVTEQIEAEIRFISRLGRQYPFEKYSGIRLDAFGNVKATEYIEDESKGKA